MVNHKYGFGLLDSGEAVKLAKEWESTGGGIHIYDSKEIKVDKKIPDFDEKNPDFAVTSSFIVDSNATVEHVVVTFSADHSIGTDLQVVLESPSGTNSTLAELHGFVPNYVVDIISPSSIKSSFSGKFFIYFFLFNYIFFLFTFFIFLFFIIFFQ